MKRVGATTLEGSKPITAAALSPRPIGFDPSRVVDPARFINRFGLRSPESLNCLWACGEGIRGTTAGVCHRGASVDLTSGDDESAPTLGRPEQEDFARFVASKNVSDQRRIDANVQGRPVGERSQTLRWKESGWALRLWIVPVTRRTNLRSNEVLMKQ